MLLDQPDHIIWRQLAFGLGAALLAALLTPFTLSGLIGMFFWVQALVAERRAEARRSLARLQLVAFFRVAGRAMTAVFIAHAAALGWLALALPAGPVDELTQAEIPAAALHMLQLTQIASLSLTATLAGVCFQRSRQTR